MKDLRSAIELLTAILCFIELLQRAGWLRSASTDAISYKPMKSITWDTDKKRYP